MGGGHTNEAGNELRIIECGDGYMGAPNTFLSILHMFEIFHK